MTLYEFLASLKSKWCGWDLTPAWDLVITQSTK